MNGIAASRCILSWTTADRAGNHRVRCTLLLVLMLGGLLARSAAAQATLAHRLDALLGQPRLRTSSVGVRVIELPGGRELYQRNADLPLIPASNMKLLTMAAALRLLGPEYRFRTVVALSGPHLVVIGGGDPTIGSEYTSGRATEHFRLWAEHLRSRGLTHIAGDLLLDDTLFDRQFVHPHWKRQHLSRPFAAPIGALALNGNCVAVRVEAAPGRGAAASVVLDPAGSGFTVAGSIRTTASGKKHLWSVYRKIGSDVVRVGGRFYRNAAPDTGRVPVDDPTRFFGYALAESLRAEGLSISGSLRRTALRGSKQLVPQVIHETELLPVLAILGKESDNHAAEQLFKLIGAVQPDARQGSWETGSRAVARTLAQWGLPLRGVQIDDGSGLSPENRVTATFITELLQRTFVDPRGSAFREALAVAGVDGTMRRRLREPPYRGRIWAKTGTLAGVRALSGYVQTPAGHWYAFSLLINNCSNSVRGIQDEFCRALVGDS